MKTLLTILVTACFLPLFAQQSAENIRKMQEKRLFSQAIEAYSKLYERDATQTEIAYELGMCYYGINDFRSAREYLTKALEGGFDHISCRYHLAQSNLRMLEYDKAYTAFCDIAKETPITAEDTFMVAESRIKSLILRTYYQGNESTESVKASLLPLINSEFSDYGIGISGNELYFSSLRKTEKSATDARTMQGYSDLFYTSLSTSEFETNNVIAMLQPINSEKYNDACPAFSQDGMQLYFTRCFGKPSHCEIMFSQKNSRGKWSNPTSISLNNKSFSTGHASINPSGNMMVFVSDQAGGVGKRDIYLSKFENGSWATATNAGKLINTSRDEMFPIFINDSVLTFCSEGHRSLGGLDVFVTVLRNNTLQTPVRLVNGINTGADDFNLIATDPENGYLCSNRPGGYGSDDIYAYNGFPVAVPLRLTVTDENLQTPLSGASIIIKSSHGIDTLITDEHGYAEAMLSHHEDASLIVAANNYTTQVDALHIDQPKTWYPEIIQKEYEMKADSRGITVEGEVIDKNTEQPVDHQKLMIIGENGYFDQAHTDSSGYYEFTNLQDDNDYKLLMARKGYWTQTKELSIPDLNSSFNYSKKTGFDLDFQLEPIDQDKEIVIRDIYYDFDKASLKPESETELKKLVSLLQQNPNISVEISSHTDSRGPDEYNLSLSQARAESVVKYLISQGISKSRLISRGYGETKPLIANAGTEDEHQLNRRTSFKVITIADINESEVVSSQLTSDVPDGQQNTTTANVIYKVQVCASRTPIESDHYFGRLNETFPDLLVVEEKYPDGFYRYIAGTFTVYSEAVSLRDKIIAAGYPDCFIGAYKNNKRVQ